VNHQKRIPIDSNSMESVTKSEFDFMLSLGYTIISAETDSVAISNGNLSLVLTIEAGSYCVMSDIRRASTGAIYSLYEALDDLVPMAAQKVRGSGRDIEVFKQCLRRLSGLCQQHLRLMFAGDENAFTRIAGNAGRHQHAYTLKMQYGAIIDKANLAWENKMWNQALDLYMSAKPALSSTEAARLAFLMSKNSLI